MPPGTLEPRAVGLKPYSPFTRQASSSRPKPIIDDQVAIGAPMRPTPDCLKRSRYASLPQQFLYFFPPPHEHGVFRSRPFIFGLFMTGVLASTTFA